MGYNIKMDPEFVRYLKNQIALFYVDHEEDICGQCEQERIRYKLAKKYLAKGFRPNANLAGFVQEVELIWHKHPLYLKYQELKSLGYSREQIEEKFSEEGLIL